MGRGCHTEVNVHICFRGQEKDNNIKNLLSCFFVRPTLPEILDVREIPTRKMRDLTITLSGKQLSYLIKDLNRARM